MNSIGSGNTGLEMNNTFSDKGKSKRFFFFLSRRTNLKVPHKKTFRQKRHDARRKTEKLGVMGRTERTDVWMTIRDASSFMTFKKLYLMTKTIV